jgi:hypothetical protein
MSGKDQLPFSSSQPQDAYYTKPRFTKPTDSSFAYLGWMTKCNFAARRRVIPPYGAAATYGQQVIFRIDKSAFKRGPIQAVWTRSAITGNGGATIARAVDYEGYASIALVEVYYGQNKLFQLTGDQLWLRHKMNYNLLEDQAANQLVFGKQSAADRTTLAGQIQTLTVDLPLYWTVDPSMYFISTGTSHELEIRITLQPVGYWTQTDGSATPTVTISSFNLTSFDVYVEDDEKMWHQMELESKEGINYMIRDSELQLNNVLASGSTQYVVPLSNFKGPCYEMIAIFRLASDRSSTAPNLANNVFNPQSINNGANPLNGNGPTQQGTYQLQASDVILWDTMNDNYARWYIFPFYHRGIPGENIYLVVFSLTPDDAKVDRGHKTWSAMTNPQFTVTFPSALGANWALDLYSRIYNNIQVSLAKPNPNPINPS